MDKRYSTFYFVQVRKRALAHHLVFFFTLIVAMFGVITSPLSWGQAKQHSRAGRGLATISTPNGEILFAEVADTPAKRAQGLMFRTNLAPDRGMLFTFPELGHWTFWMKNTKIPLDIIWLDGSGKVVHIEPHVPICTRTDDGCPRYHSLKKAVYVLELKANMAERYEIHTGTPLLIAFP